MKIDASDLACYAARRIINWLIALFVICMIIFAIASTAKCQYPVKPSKHGIKPVDHLSYHTDEDEWEDTIAVKFITITSMDKELIYYYVTRKFEQRLSSIAFDRRTLFQEGKQFTPDGCFLMIYCKKHLMAYVLSRIKCTEGGHYVKSS